MFYVLFNPWKSMNKSVKYTKRHKDNKGSENPYIHVWERNKAIWQLSWLGEFTMVSQPIRLILVDWFVFHFFLGCLPFFHFFLGRLPFFFWGCLSSLVKIRLHTENQLPRLSGSALKVPGWWVGWGGVDSYPLLSQAPCDNKYVTITITNQP